MSLELTLTAPFIKELNITLTSLYLEVPRLSIFCCIWDMPAPAESCLRVSKHDTGKGVEVRVGPVVLSVAIEQPASYGALLAE